MNENGKSPEVRSNRVTDVWVETVASAVGPLLHTGNFDRAADQLLQRMRDRAEGNGYVVTQMAQSFTSCPYNLDVIMTMTVTVFVAKRDFLEQQQRMQALQQGSGPRRMN